MAIQAVTENEMMIPTITLTVQENEEEAVLEETPINQGYQQLDLNVQSRQEITESMVLVLLDIQRVEAKIQGYKDMIAYEKSELKLLEQRHNDYLHDLEVGQQRLNLEVTLEEASDDGGIDTSELDDEPEDEALESDEPAKETEGEDEQ